MGESPGLEVQTREVNRRAAEHASGFAGIFSPILVGALVDATGFCVLPLLIIGVVPSWGPPTTRS